MKMSNQTFCFNFKFVYNEDPIRLCAYINHCFNFAELKAFLDYWVCNLKNVPYIPPALYWIDNDGDQFPVANEMDYKMFKARNSLNGVLYGTSNGVNRSITSPVSNNPYTHLCETCERCEENKYIVNAKGEMICINCAYKRGICCLLVIEGSNNVSGIPVINNELFQRYCENEQKFDNIIEEVKATAEEASAEIVAKKNDEISMVVDEQKTAGDIDGSFVQMSINNGKMAEMPKKSTGAIPKIRKLMPEQKVPYAVEDALQQMRDMGFDNDNMWLTNLLMSTKGRIDKALDKISSDPTYRKRKLF